MLCTSVLFFVCTHFCCFLMECGRWITDSFKTVWLFCLFFCFLVFGRAKVCFWAQHVLKYALFHVCALDFSSWVCCFCVAFVRFALAWVFVVFSVTFCHLIVMRDKIPQTSSRNWFVESSTFVKIHKHVDQSCLWDFTSGSWNQLKLFFVREPFAATCF